MIEGIGAVIAVIILLIIFGDSNSGDDRKYDKTTLGIDPNSDGSFSVYDKTTQNILFTGSFNECCQWIEENSE